jgi:hypothetical protein
MINRQALLADLQKFLQRIEADLLERSESTEVPEVPAALHAEYEKAAKAERTAQNYEDWRTDTITQAAAAWVLSCVFVRFLEDNSLIDPPKFAGPCERLARARDEHELYFRSHPQHTDREYLLSTFAELAKLPGTRDIFGEHNAINDLPNWLSGDAAGELLNFFQKIDASTGDLVHDFTDPNWDTRFLGDLYQDLSEAARKKFALLQTPDFVEEFILDRTLEPAIDEFGLVPQAAPNSPHAPTCFKMIDPACGSGHFLLGVFPRLLDRWQRKEPGTNIRELTQRALNSIHGVDINPFAVAIAKFRLLLAALRSCNIGRISNAPAFRIQVACGDSLLHGENRTSTGQQLWDYADGASDQELYSHSYPGEDLSLVRSILRAGAYHCVVANPPYIVPKDSRLNIWYRKRYSACHMKYSLSVPFMQQIFQLCREDGFNGQITSNSFMKREFGKKLIEDYLPTVELTHVIDSSGAFIPGHATPTVILFGRKRAPIRSSVTTVLGVRGEPETPAVPADGMVWKAIVVAITQGKSSGEMVDIAELTRDQFYSHPWSLTGGGAVACRELIESYSSGALKDICKPMGFTAIPCDDDAFVFSDDFMRRKGLQAKAFVTGELLRDWVVHKEQRIVFPYQEDFETPLVLEDNISLLKHFWPFRTTLKNRSMFGKNPDQHGIAWYGYMQFITPRAKAPYTIGFPNVASHNQFCLIKRGELPNQNVNIIQLKDEDNEQLAFALLAYLNSSLFCFWMKQACHQKQMMGGESVRIESKAKVPYAFSATAVSRGPLPPEFLSSPYRPVLTALTTEMLELVENADLLRSQWVSRLHEKTPENWINLQQDFTSLRAKQVLLQEEIDFTVYVMFGLADASLLMGASLPKALATEGSRPFCLYEGKNEDGFDVPTSVPNDFPDDLKRVWNLRLEAIESSPNIRVLESSSYKRRWIGRQGKYNHSENVGSLEDVCRLWLLDRLESYSSVGGHSQNGDEISKDHLPEINPCLISLAALSDLATQDEAFQRVGSLFRGDLAFDVRALILHLVESESVPALPFLVYKPSGLIKKGTWERIWAIQRRADSHTFAEPSSLTVGSLESVNEDPYGSMPPARYDSKDFLDGRIWRLRGKLDVPKERWISFPHCEGPDGTLVICWAGYDHLQQAQAISAYYVRVQTEFGGSDDPRLIPLLASLIELLPWLKQWHNEPNANFDGLRMGEYFEGFINEEARALGKTLDEIRAWSPPKGQRGRVAKGQSVRKKGQSPKGSKGQSEEGAAEA